MSSPSTQSLPVGTTVFPRRELDLAQAPNVDRFINRDLSLIEFNRRVLGEAQDSRLPILERLKFIAIFSSLLDEFFMIRVSALKEQIQEAIVSPDAIHPKKLLKSIRKSVLEMTETQSNCLSEEIVPELKEQGI